MNRSANQSNRITITKYHSLSTAIMAGGLLVLVSGCLPPLRRADPGPALPQTYMGASSPNSSAKLSWRNFFEDPKLKALIQQTLVGSQQLKILAQQIQIARNTVMGRRGAYLPMLGVGAGAGLAKISKYSTEGALDDLLDNSPAVASLPGPLPDFGVGTNLSWQIDIWRKLRNARDAAALRFLGTQQGWNYVVTKLVAEVAGDYYELMALDNKLMALNQIIDYQERSLSAAETKLAAAAGTKLGVQRFKAAIRKNQARKKVIQQQIIKVTNHLNFIMGRFPQPIARTSDDFLKWELPELSIGAPSQLLQNRYDVVQAERQLSAAGLDVKVARARFYPTFNIFSGVGWSAFNAGYLFITPEALIYNVAGQLAAPLINRAAIKADYLSANAEQMQAVYHYQRTIIEAVQEVATRMAKVKNYTQAIQLKTEQLRQLQGAINSAMTLFKNAHPGVDYLDVLLAQRSYLNAKIELIDIKQQQLAAIVNTYQALGGGGALRSFEYPPVRSLKKNSFVNIGNRVWNWFPQTSLWDFMPQHLWYGTPETTSWDWLAPAGGWDWFPSMDYFD